MRLRFVITEVPRLHSSSDDESVLCNQQHCNIAVQMVFHYHLAP